VEVEMAINSHPKVAESAVVAVPSSLSEDEGKAFIVLKSGQDLRPEEMIQWCLDKLADFKVPRYLEFRESLPKTPTQRVEKYVLKRESLANRGIDMQPFLEKLAAERKKGRG
jgi:crotonobetaine/carnitine-CoA ligase